MLGVEATYLEFSYFPLSLVENLFRGHVIQVTLVLCYFMVIKQSQCTQEYRAKYFCSSTVEP